MTDHEMNPEPPEPPPGILPPNQLSSSPYPDYWNRAAPQGNAGSREDLLPAGLPSPEKAKGRTGKLTTIVTATALIAAVIGGVSGAVIVGWDDNTAASSSSVTNTGAANGQLVSHSSADVSAIAAKVLPSVVEITANTRSGAIIGSGVILSADGKILTNAHVVEGVLGDVTIILSDGAKYQASVLGGDNTADIAVLQAKNASGLTPATLGDSSSVKVGESVVAIGSPGGLQNTVTSGIISATNRQLSDLSNGDSGSNRANRSVAQQDSPSYTAIQTDAAINQGNSGGALVNSAGDVIGINSALYNPTSTGSIGIGFAIPINDAKVIVNKVVGG